MAETQPKFVEKLFSVKDRTVLQKGVSGCVPESSCSPSPLPVTIPVAETYGSSAGLRD